MVEVVRGGAQRRYPFIPASVSITSKSRRSIERMNECRNVVDEDDNERDRKKRRKKEEEKHTMRDTCDSEKLKHGDGRRRGGRKFTISVAFSAAVVAVAQTRLLASLVTAQLARAAAVFCIDEVVIFVDGSSSSSSLSNASSSSAAPPKQKTFTSRFKYAGAPGSAQPSGAGTASTSTSEHDAAFAARLMQFLDTPQYLRRALVPVDPHLRFAGHLPPLDAPHHPRCTEWTSYREGVVLGMKHHDDAKAHHDDDDDDGGGDDDVSVSVGQADVGLIAPVRIRLGKRLRRNARRSLASMEGQRVTVRMGESRPDDMDESGGGTSESVFDVVPSDEPRRKKGLYWGFTTRLASSLLDAMNKEKSSSSPRRLCDIDGREPYDLIIGTSERGKLIETLVDKNGLHRGGEGGFPRFKRCMIVFGGPRGLEPVMEPLKLGPEDCFDYYVNTCASQGSRTIRTEEAALISLARLIGPLRAAATQ